MSLLLSKAALSNKSYFCLTKVTFVDNLKLFIVLSISVCIYCFFIVCWNNKGPLFLSDVMALNDLCVPMRL